MHTESAPSSGRAPNRLAGETSPYLQQHAHNPVDWYPWGEEALSRARTEDKPILLSVGYSACHWCHVMAHESFEDPDVAAEMNRLFVNIKVDREERPDLDQIYQTAHHLLTRRSGGWPLTLFLMPDGTPFFGGTYFPKAPRYGMPGFLDLLPKIAAAYREQRAEIHQQNDALLDLLKRATAVPANEGLEPEAGALDTVVEELARHFDAEEGGIGQAPKFPHPHELAYCLRRYASTGSDIALEMPRLTLRKMAEGGIYDQLGGGFCRYSVDGHWTIPHFEKMLYDNGPLLELYADAWRVTREPLFQRIVEETCAWTMREMQATGDAGPAGYYSSLDADSEGEEGRYYVWDAHEVQALLDADEFAVLARHYDLDHGPNFEDRHWHLRVSQPLADVAAAVKLEDARCVELLNSARRKLLTAREQRIRPGRDEKILTSWNGLMIRGMARCARIFQREDWLRSAQGAADFVRSTLWRDGRLLATYKDGRAHLNAYLDDYAFLLDGLLELLQSEFRPADLAFARELADVLLAQFEDTRDGGFFFTSHDHEKLIQRSKTVHDNATPSGNGVAACALQRLGHLISEPRYLAAAERAIRLCYPILLQQPSACSSIAAAVEEWLQPPQIVILRGHDAAPWRAWHAALNASYRPHTLVLGIPAGMSGLPEALDKPAHGDSSATTAWVCRGLACLPAIDDLRALEEVLETPGRPAVS